MKKLSIYTKRLFTISALLIILCAFQQALYHQKLGKIAAIDFPGKPQAVDTLGQHLHHYTDSSSFFYLAGVSDLEAEPAGGYSKREVDSLYAGYIRGTLTESAGELVSKESFQVNGLQGFEIKYITSKPNMSNLRFKRILYLDSEMLYVDFWTDKDKDAVSKSFRERFFNSLKITAVKASQQDSHRKDTAAFNLGYIIGQVIVGIALVGAILAVVIYIKNRRKKTVTEY
jgi:hypothetical protein